MNENKAKLFQKLLAVQRSLEPTEKSGQNSFHKYSYSTAGDVLLPVQKACNEQGLVIVASVISSKIEPGKAEVVVSLAVIDSETGESHEVTSPGYAEDFSYKDNRPSGDKAVYKAITGATKYAVRSFFLLPSEDDPERDKPAAKLTRTATASSLIDQTTTELKRLGWSSERGRLYLQEKFGKTSRQQLTDTELVQFLNQLKAMPTPALSDTRS